jgi:zeaxanthin glucosyltransferase
MRIGFLAPCAPGHLHPMTALARELKRRGHDVVVLGVLDAEPLVRAAQLHLLRIVKRNTRPVLSRKCCSSWAP